MTKIRDEKCCDMNFNGNYSYFMSTLYVLSSISEKANKITIYRRQRTNERTKKNEKTNGENDEEKKESLQPTNESSTFYNVQGKNETYPCSCGICIIYFISINPFICIIQGSPAIAIPCALRHSLILQNFFTI